MKKQGFTLVELLAVIVILGIILLIAVPKISNVIDNSKEKAFQVSSFGIVKAANYYCENKRLTDLTYPGGTFTASNGKLINGGEELPVTDITLAGDSFVNIDENCNVQMSVTDGLYYATKEYDEVGVAVTLSENAALTRDQMTQEIEALQADVVALNSKISDPTNNDNVFLKVYPVGSIYMSKESANPSTLFGGTWIAWGSGRVPVGVDIGQTEFNTVEKTGGEKTHTLTIEEMPNHSHVFTGSTATTASSGSHSHTFSGTTNADGWHTHLMNITHSDGTLVTAEYINIGLSYGQSRMRYNANFSGTHSHAFSGTTSGVGDHNHSVIANGSNSSIGGGSSHNNLQPYITVYMWKRTA